MINFEDKELQTFVKHILTSYKNFYEEDLISTTSNNILEASFNAPFVLISHNNEADPIFKFGNLQGLKLWELTWKEFTQMPSKKTAEVDLQENRKKLLDEVSKNGYAKNYFGIRISSTGKRFKIENVKIWNVLDEKNQKIGQAASFKNWTYL